MKTTCAQMNRYGRRVLAVLCVAAIGSGGAWAQNTSSIPADQLDSLVAPIALYPDPLLAQTLAASTYPLEIMQLQQWLARNTGLQGKALADAVAKQPWDPSVQAMAALPDVVKHLADNIQWTTDLGNAFLAQQADVMHAVQRMRAKAENNGNLQSTPQQTVQTQVIENERVIVIEQASPDVVYVPTYQSAVVYGAPVYPYPALTYDDDYPWGAAAISFGAGVAMGAFWGSGGWGWRPGWGGAWGDWDVNINRNNNFIRNTNIGNINRAGAINNRWQHNPTHRGGAPYRDRATANRYGGTARGDSLANRQASARQQLSSRQGNLASPGSLANRSGAGNLGNRAVGTSGQLSSRDLSRGAGGVNRSGQRDLSRNSGGSYPWQSASRAAGAGGNLSSRDFSRGATGADRIGQRDLSRAGGSNAWGGGSFASSQRGSSSFQSHRSSGGSSFRSGGGQSRSFGGGSRSFGGGGGGRSFGGGGRSRGGGGRR